MTYIYGLHHPETGELRYIGKANDVEKRLKSHMRDMLRRNTPLYCWMRTLNAPPKIAVLEAVDGEWMEAERRLIAAHRATGRLLNLADGGNEPSCPTSTRAANGRKIAALVHSSPHRRKVWELKKALGTALAQGVLTNYAKQKMRAAALKHPALFGAWASI